MDQVFEVIRTRRSTRSFADRPVDQELLDQVLEAGRYAPSGGNSQTAHFLVIRSRTVMDTLAALVKQELAAMEVTEGMYRSLANAIRNAKKEHYVFHYSPPVLILAANQKDYGNAMADCACALENMMIMANALDLGTCWINQVRWLTENPVILDFLHTLGLSDSERIFGGLSLGWADTEDGLPVRTPLPRHGNPVTWID